MRLARQLPAATRYVMALPRNLNRVPRLQNRSKASRAQLRTPTRDPAVVNQAFKIAENELLLAEIAMHKVSVVERLRERYAAPFTEKDNSLDLGKARFLAAWLAEQSIKARLPAVLRKYEPKWIEEKVTKACADLAASLEGTSDRFISCVLTLSIVPLLGQSTLKAYGLANDLPTHRL